MRRLPALVAALLLPSPQPLLLGAAVSTGALVVSQVTAHAENAESVAKVAQAITVRLEGATQGSGVLVKREGNCYTVLTAWHNVSEQTPGEELDIYTADGQRHPFEPGSIRQLGDVDLAVVRFISAQDFELASISRNKLSNDDVVYVSGFPLNGGKRLLVETAKIIWPVTYGLADGYQILSQGFTKAGMSGGPLLDSNGLVIGIHGRGERAKVWDREIGKTGINQSIPIRYFQFLSSRRPVEGLMPSGYSDEYLTKIRSIASSSRISKESLEVIADYASKSLRNQSNPEAYFYRAYSRDSLGDTQAAISDYRASINTGTDNKNAFKNLAYILWKSGDMRESCRYLRVASALGSRAANELMGTKGGGPCKGDQVQVLECRDLENIRVCK